MKGIIDLPSDKNVFFRIKPNKDSAWWARLNGGQIVEIISESNGWTRAKAIDKDGYIDSKFVKPFPDHLQPNEDTLPEEPIPSTPYDYNALKHELQGILERAQQIVAILTE